MNGLELTATLAERDLDVDLRIGRGETIALLGPNGAGKSTILGVVAGLLRPECGRLVVNERVLADVGSDRSVWTPPHARGIAMLAQDPLLFPHLSAADNVAFAPRSRGQRRHRSREAARLWLDEVGATELAERRPSQLSGGQAQRIAVARALAAEPDVLLLDEPMAALDVTAVPQMRQLLQRVLRDRTAIIVTHDVIDALMLADRVVVMESGRIVESGPSADLLASPRSAFGAQLADLNLCVGVGVAGGVRLADGTVAQSAAAEIEVGEPAVAVFEPRAVSVHLEPPGGSPRNAWPAVVSALEHLGGGVRVRLDGPAGTPLSADVTPAAVTELGLVPSVPVVLAVKASEVRAYRQRDSAQNTSRSDRGAIR